MDGNPMTRLEARIRVEQEAAGPLGSSSAGYRYAGWVNFNESAKDAGCTKFAPRFVDSCQKSQDYSLARGASEGHNVKMHQVFTVNLSVPRWRVGLV